MRALSLAFYAVIISPTQSHGAGGEAFSVDDLRDPRWVAKVYVSACSSLATFIILSVTGITFSWSAYASKSNSILR